MKSIKIFLAVILLLGCYLCVYTTVHAILGNALENHRYVVVIDAGHGGIDGGAVGIKTGVKESDLTLEISKLIASYLEASSTIDVVLTRDSPDGLYSEKSKNKKLDDLNKRKSIILSYNPCLVVSIHCNKFPNPNRRGAQVFFSNTNESNNYFASILQMNVNMLNSKYLNRTFSALMGDYFIIKCTSFTSALVECGFLSNSEDEKLLLDPIYLDELARCIHAGILSFVLNIIC
ncbi:MAG: N-acetylmuramoyl-L-alanine amidase [Christensenellaceae bacterium]|jgi:N-acetylmuramoyl-L-alanine amidase|nr:N-acetylmuramoyl-L-alanine amidase [Christensenellaceae bacterium]